jgi:hypothetical protein
MTQLSDRSAAQPSAPRAKQHPLRVLARDGRKRARRARAVVESRMLDRRERRTRGSMLGSAPVVVSLTTYGSRIDTVHLTIESIARGAVRPARMILWIDSIDALKALPPALERQRGRGLEILLADNYGPHTKYYPYVESETKFTVPLVTADDDIIYPSNWLAGILTAHRAHPHAIVGYWIRRIAFGADGRPAAYTSWPYASDTRAHAANVPLGVSGVLYPTRMLESLRERGTAFKAVAPSTDDLWLHAVAVRSSIEVRQIRDTPVHFLTVPGSQETSLAAVNVSGSGNDRVVAELYTSADLALIRDLTR